MAGRFHRKPKEGVVPDARDEALAKELNDALDAVDPWSRGTPQLWLFPRPTPTAPNPPKPSLDDLDAPLPDSADAARADRVWADWRERLEQLLRDPGLSEKTQAFLESLDEQLTNKGYLSPGQTDAIEEIEQRRDGGRSRY